MAFAWGAATVTLAGLGYALTLAPELGLGDTAILIDQILRLELSSHVNSHNLTLVTGWLLSHLPFGSTAVRAHLVSWLYGTLGIGLCWLLLRAWRLPAAPAALSALVLAASHSYWWHSTLLESYAANAVMLLAMLLALHRHQHSGETRWLALAAALSGLALFNHVQMGTLGLACLVWAVLPWTPGTPTRNFATVVGAGVVGLLPWLGLLVRDLTRRSDANEVLRWAAGGDFQGIMFKVVGNPLTTFAELVAQQFPSPFLLAIPVGLWAVRRERSLWAPGVALGVVWVVNTAFFLFYRTWDQFAFYLPTWVTMALVGALGVRELHARWPLPTLGALVVSIAIPILFYPQIPTIADANPEGYWATRFPNAFTRNTHDVRAYLTSPDKSSWTDVRDFSDALWESLPPGSTFFDDDSRTYYPLHFYQQHERTGQGIRLVLLNSWGFDNWGTSSERVLGLIRSSRAPVFVVCDMDPFRTTLAPLFEEGWRMKPFDLGEGRWVYELVRQPTDWTPAPIGELTLRPRGRKRTTSRPGGRALAKVELPEGRTPRWVSWTWLRPDGAEAPAPKARLVASMQDETSAWLDIPKDAELGLWTVVLAVDGVEQARASLEVTAE